MTPLEQRRYLRKHATKPERLLWAHLRKHKTGAKWRRQHPCGPYVLDFYCPELRLAVELDGLSHQGDRAKALDDVREVWLSSSGIRTLRFDNTEVLDDPQEVASRIAFAMRDSALERRCTSSSRRSHCANPHPASP